MSLVVVVSALPFRASTVPFVTLVNHWPIIANLLAGSLVGAWLGAGWATGLKSATLYRIIASLLAAIAAVLLVGRDLTAHGAPLLGGTAQIAAGVAAGIVIDVVASLLGVAGGELLIPTIVLRKRSVIPALC
jgi:uncharacterized protein